MPSVKFIRGLIASDATDDRLAIARAFAVLPLLAAIKIYLYVWYRRQGIDPLAETQVLVRWLLVGPDVLLCAFVAPLHRLFVFATRSSLPALHFGVGFVVPFTLHAAIVFVAAVNVRVNQIYGQALSFDLLAYANNLMVMRDSIVATIDAAFVLALVFGLALFFAAPASARALGRLRGFGTPLGAWCVLVVVAGIFGVGSYRAFRGIYNYGLKSNPVLELARTYRRVANEGSYVAQKAELEKAFASDRGAALAFDSLEHADDVDGLPDLANTARGMNFVLLLLESTPARYVDAETAPNLTRLGVSSLRLTNYFTTAPFTFDAQFAIFYSEPIRGTALDVPTLYNGPPKQHSLVELFHSNGYATGIFHSSFIEFHHMAWQFDHKGVDTLVSAGDLIGAHPGWSWGAREEDTVARMITWIGEHRAQPFFAVYNPVCPHHPYHTPGGVRAFHGQDLESNFKNALHYTDVSVGRLLDALEHEGLSDHTVVVVVSDHGETVNQFGGGHGLLFSSDELRVPMFVRAPALVSRTSTLFANHLDLAPTVAGMFGFEVPSDWLGRNLTAQHVKPRILYVGLGVGLNVGLIDEGVALVRSEKEHSTHMFAVATDPFTSLSTNMHQKDYEGDVTTLDDKIKLRHLEHALP